MRLQTNKLLSLFTDGLNMKKFDLCEKNIMHNRSGFMKLLFSILVVAFSSYQVMANASAVQKNKVNIPTQVRKDITQSGNLSYKDLQKENELDEKERFNQAMIELFSPYQRTTERDYTLSRLSLTHKVPDPMHQSSGGKDYWGNSIFDETDRPLSQYEYEHLQDTRANNQQPIIIVFISFFVLLVFVVMLLLIKSDIES